MSVTTPAADTDFFSDGVTTADIQSDVAIADGDITGTSKYKASWNAAGFDPDAGTNYLAIHVKGASGSIVGGGVLPSQGSGIVDAASNEDDFIFQITPDTRQVIVRASKDGETQERIFDLAMTLEEE